MSEEPTSVKFVESAEEFQVARFAVHESSSCESALVRAVEKESGATLCLKELECQAKVPANNPHEGRAQ